MTMTMAMTMTIDQEYGHDIEHHIAKTEVGGEYSLFLTTLFI